MKFWGVWSHSRSLPSPKIKKRGGRNMGLFIFQSGQNMGHALEKYGQDMGHLKKIALSRKY